MHIKRHDKAKELQAQNRSNDGKAVVYRFSIDAPTKQDIEYIHHFCIEHLDCQPTTSVLLRAAFSAYVDKIRNAIIHMHSLKGEDAIDAYREFTQFEREEIFHVAGQSHNLNRDEYKTH